MVKNKNELINGFKNKIINALDKIDYSQTAIDVVADLIADKIENKSGRVIFIGAGISADIANIVVNQLKFDFQVEDVFISITAGKKYGDLIVKWKELEEIPSVSIFELNSVEINSNDILFAFSASGKTKYIISAIKYAKERGCKTVLMTDFDNSTAYRVADYVINTNFGKPSIIGLNPADGGTIQKIYIDNLIFTSLEKAGRLYKGNIVFLRPITKKIERNCIEIICNLTNLSVEEATLALNKNNRSLEHTIISTLKNVDYNEADKMLIENNFNFNKII